MNAQLNWSCSTAEYFNSAKNNLFHCKLLVNTLSLKATNNALNSVCISAFDSSVNILSFNLIVSFSIAICVKVFVLATYLHSSYLLVTFGFTCIIAPSFIELVTAVNSETLPTFKIGLYVESYLIFLLLDASVLIVSNQFTVSIYVLLVGKSISQFTKLLVNFTSASNSFNVYANSLLASLTSLNIVCLGLKATPYFSTSLSKGSGTDLPDASTPHKLSINLLPKSSGIILLLSPSRNSFQALCFCPIGFKFLLKLICKFCSSSLIIELALLNTKEESLMKLINGNPCPTGSARSLASSNVL